MVVVLPKLFPRKIEQTSSPPSHDTSLVTQIPVDTKTFRITSSQSYQTAGTVYRQFSSVLTEH